MKRSGYLPARRAKRHVRDKQRSIAISVPPSPIGFFVPTREDLLQCKSGKALDELTIHFGGQSVRARSMPDEKIRLKCVLRVGASDARC